MAAVLQAARLGYVGRLALQPPESGDGFERVDTEACTPDNLGLALDALEADTVLVEALGADLVAQHLAVKRTEWSALQRRHRLGAARVPAVPVGGRAASPSSHRSEARCRPSKTA